MPKAKKTVKTKATPKGRLSSNKSLGKATPKTKTAKKAKVVKKATPKKVIVVKPKIAGKKVGVVTHWYGHISVAIFKLSAPLNVGDKIKIVRGDHVVDDTVKSMQMNHEAITSAKKGMEVGVKLKKEVHEGAVVYIV